MRKLMCVDPEGWPCTLESCPPGFFVFNDGLCFKSEYRNENGSVEAFCESGEAFWGGGKTIEDRSLLIVQPVEVFMRDSEE